MAVEYVIFCDDCGGVIHASRRSVRAARAEAQLQCGAVSAGGRDRCRSCRAERSTSAAGPATAGAPSVGTQRN